MTARTNAEEPGSFRQRPAPAVGRVTARAAFETRAILGNGEQLILSLVLPLAILFTLSLTGILEVFGYTGSNHTAVALAGVLGVSIASNAFTGQAIATAFERRYGVLRHTATTPLGVSGLVAGKIAAVLAVTVVQYALAFACAAFLGLEANISISAVVLSAALGTAAFVGLALLMAGTMRPEAVLAFANLLWAAMAGGGGLLIDHGGTWGSVVGFLPSGALGSALRSAVVDGRFDWMSLLVLAVWAVIAAGAARRWFSYDDR